MTDLHAHILFGLDDGPQDINESIRLLKNCALSGVTQIAATSHYYSSTTYYESYINRRNRRIQALNEEISNQDLNIKIIPAAEVYMSEFLLNLKSLDDLKYGNSEYILLEIPRSELPTDRVIPFIEQLISYFGIKPVIAHVEKYPFLIARKSNLEMLNQIGCLLQVDAESLLPGAPLILRARVMSLIKKGYIDVIASDCHDCIRRPQNLSRAYEVIEKKAGAVVTRLLKDTADKIFSDAVQTHNVGI